MKRDLSVMVSERRRLYGVDPPFRGKTPDATATETRGRSEAGSKDRRHHGTDRCDPDHPLGFRVRSTPPRTARHEKFATVSVRFET